MLMDVSAAAAAAAAAVAAVSSEDRHENPWGCGRSDGIVFWRVQIWHNSFLALFFVNFPHKIVQLYSSFSVVFLALVFLNMFGRQAMNIFAGYNAILLVTKRSSWTSY